MLNKREIIHPRNVKKIIIITGQQRSGKSTLSKIVSTLKGPVNIRVDLFIDSLFSLKRINHINKRNFHNILKIYLNSLIIDSNYGRNYNLKKNDESSIFNTINPGHYLKTIKKDFSKSDIKKSLLKNNEIVMMLHNFLEFLNVFPNDDYKLKIVNIKSHPIDQIYSMYKSKTNFKFDNLSWEIIYIYKKKKFCLSLGLEDDFNNLNLMQKILLIKKNQDEKEFKNIKNFKKNYELLNIYYEDLITNPIENIKLISKFTNKKQTTITKKLMDSNKKKKLFLDLNERKKRLIFINSKLKNSKYKKILASMITNFNTKYAQSKNI